MEFINSILFMLSEMAPYILLGFFLAGILHAFVPQRLLSRHLSSNSFGAVWKGALIGVPLPLCSCGVLPTAIAMKRSGASDSATVSFLVATPQTGVDSIAATWSLLGPAFAVIRPVVALITSLFAGSTVAIVEKGKTNKPQENPAIQCAVESTPRMSLLARTGEALRYGFIDLVGSIGGWLVAGLIIAALITVFVPADIFAALSRWPILAMLAVIVVAIPMYVCATGSIPIAMSLMLKGLSPGTALVFLMAGPAANFASYSLIAREMGRRTALIYIATIAIGAIAFGLLIDWLLPTSWFAFAPDVHSACHHSPHIPLFAAICSGVLVLLLLYSFGRRIFHRNSITKDTPMTTTYKIKGMNCTHCQAAVQKAIAALPGVDAVDVNLTASTATVEGTATPADVAQAVRIAGYDITE
ncbi:MAG: SO_0444 family Cu/Zn efflux transporter [Paramuribaculum sp.]|nr:SO_0444 family Cu/Zn efflux transporter [Paramuribaculum sp.]